MTLKDVAREAGVSAHSVSAVLNGNADRYRISQATQERIEKMARELGYDPDNNRSARQMAARKHGITIPNNVIAVCSISNSGPMHQQPFESEILDGIESAADQHGMDVLQCRLRSERFPRLIEKGEVDGVIVLSARMEQINALQLFELPIIKLGSSSPATHSVSAGHYEGMLLATSHLIAQGHRHIAFIGHDFTLSERESALVDAGKQRFAGFQASLQKAKLPVRYVDNSLRDHYPEEGGRVFKELWKKSSGKITAVVCYNDVLSMGVIQAAREISLAVPEDLSVVGFDAVSARFAFEPFIASVGYDRVLMGKRAVEILMQVRQIENGIAGASSQRERFIQDELPVHFVEGATTAPPKK